MSDHKDIYVNGTKEEPKKKTKLSLDIDWQKIALEKQKEKKEK